MTYLIALLALAVVACLIGACVEGVRLVRQRAQAERQTQRIAERIRREGARL
jgi:uncharacterized integral membrane protein